ncbi:MAG: hypothetical protein CMD29_03650 [Flavobacteriales bacterium]|nr:hypothetical protein [Flavobacteriales bacterium]
MNGRAIMYANKITNSMKKTIDETSYRREKQKNFNLVNKITPRQINKTISNIFDINDVKEERKDSIISSSDIENMSKDLKEKEIKKYRKEMERAAKSLDFIEAAKFRDLIKKLKE